MNSTESPLFDIARRLSSQVFGEVIEDHLIAEVAKAAHDKLRESAILNDMFAGTKAKLILEVKTNSGNSSELNTYQDKRSKRFQRP